MVNPSGFLKPLFYSSIPHLSFMYSFPNPEPIFSLILIFAAMIGFYACFGRRIRIPINITIVSTLPASLCFSKYNISHPECHLFLFHIHNNLSCDSCLYRCCKYTLFKFHDSANSFFYYETKFSIPDFLVRI